MGADSHFDTLPRVSGGAGPVLPVEKRRASQGLSSKEQYDLRGNLMVELPNLDFFCMAQVMYPSRNLCFVGPSVRKNNHSLIEV